MHHLASHSVGRTTVREVDHGRAPFFPYQDRYEQRQPRHQLSVLRGQVQAPAEPALPVQGQEDGREGQADRACVALGQVTRRW